MRTLKRIRKFCSAQVKRLVASSDRVISKREKKARLSSCVKAIKHYGPLDMKPREFMRATAPSRKRRR